MGRQEKMCFLLQKREICDKISYVLKKNEAIMEQGILEKQFFQIIKDEKMEDDIKLHKIDMLIRIGGNVNAMYGAKSVLLYAKSKGDNRICELLARNGAKEIFDEEEAKKIGNEICLCCSGEDPDINKIKELIDMGGKDSVSVYALISASSNNNLELVKLLVENGVDINEQDEDERTALMWTSVHNSFDVAKFLIEKGADIEKKDSRGWSALMIASIFGRYDILKLLIENGANINVRSKSEDTALIKAVLKKRIDIVKILVENGVDINAKVCGGETALMKAVLCGCCEIAEYLIEKGADFNIKNDMGKNVIKLAPTSEIRKTIIEFIKNKKEKENGGSFLGKIKKGLGIGE